jgi:hypothetical protein
MPQLSGNEPILGLNTPSLLGALRPPGQGTSIH